MSRGKYSPALTRAMIESKTDDTFIFNYKGEIPPPHPGPELWDSKVHFGNYDSEGFDYYGYSGVDAEGNFVGHGEGIDRAGYTEMDYLHMTDDEFNDIASGYF